MLWQLMLTPLACLAILTAESAGAGPADDGAWLELPGGRGPGRGKTIVLVSGDEEYRSEQVLPQMARILSARHGFRTVVLFAVDPADGAIAPNVSTNIPGLERLENADLLVLFTRFRNLPDEQMRHIAAYVESGRPVVGMRTATHAFNLTGPTYARWSWNSREPGWEGGFGRRVLGETWIDHHGEHGRQGTRGMPAPGMETHPVWKGISPGSLFGVTDVYKVRLPLPGDSVPVVLGQVTRSLDPASPAADDRNDPMMPVAWTRTYTGASGKAARVFTTTMGAAQDLLHEGTRRMLVNGIYWALGMESRLPAQADVRLVGEYVPEPFGFRRDEDWKPGRRPADLAREKGPTP